MDLHAVGGSEAGASDEQIAAIKAGTWRELTDLSEPDRVALELAERETLTPPGVDDTFFARLQAHFEPPQIVELVAICAWENFRARFNRALGIEGHGFYQPESAPPASGS